MFIWVEVWFLVLFAGFFLDLLFWRLVYVFEWRDWLRDLGAILVLFDWFIVFICLGVVWFNLFAMFAGWLFDLLIRVLVNSTVYTYSFVFATIRFDFAFWCFWVCVFALVWVVCGQVYFVCVTVNFWWFVLVGRFVFGCTWWVVLDLIVCIVVYCFLLVLVWWNLLFLILFWWLVLTVYAVRFICRDSCGYCLTSLVFIYGLFNSAFDFTLRLFVFTFAISFVECCVCRFAFWFLGVGYFAFVGLFLCLLF